MSRQTDPKSPPWVDCPDWEEYESYLDWQENHPDVDLNHTSEEYRQEQIEETQIPF